MFQWIFNHLPMLWLGLIMVGGGTASMIWKGVVVLRAYDVRWDPQRCDNARPTRINLAKARRRQVSWLSLGAPLLILASLLFLAQLHWNSLMSYTLIAFGCFLTAPLRKMWGIAVGRRVDRRQHNGQKSPNSYWHDVAYYYSWGFGLPSKPAEHVWFEDRLRFLNKVQKLWFIVQVWRFWGILAQALLSLAWPVTAVYSAFYHMDEADNYNRPWWRFDRTPVRQS